MICPVCRTFHKDIDGHLLNAHPGVIRRGDIYWLSRTEALYHGRKYKEEKPKRSTQYDRELVIV